MAAASESSPTNEGVHLTTTQLKTLDDFYILNEIGEGSYSTVMLASTKETHKRYALKVCSKMRIQREKKVKHVFRERDNLRLLSTKENQKPFIVTLYATFQDEESLYFVLSYAPYRDIGEKMRNKVFDIELTRFLTAEICLALGYIHSKGILHRDVKPENILVRDNYHIMLSDFGCSIKTEEINERADNEEIKRKSSFVGSHLYVCPEILNGEQIDETCDFFSVGSILFEMLVGKAPFHDLSEYLVFRRIAHNKYTFPDDFADSNAKDLIKKLLHPKLNERFGTKATGGFNTIKNHAFFESIDWEKLVDEPSPFAKHFESSATNDSATKDTEKFKNWS